MCTSIVEVIAADGMAKGPDEWFSVTHASIAYDHARHALLADAITIDFINQHLPPGSRAAVELSLDSAKQLQAALSRAITAAEAEEAERSTHLAEMQRTTATNPNAEQKAAA